MGWSLVSEEKKNKKQDGHKCETARNINIHGG